MKKVIISMVGVLAILGLGGYILMNNNNESIKPKLDNGAVAIGSGHTELGGKACEGAMSFGNTIGGFSELVK